MRKSIIAVIFSMLCFLMLSNVSYAGQSVDDDTKTVSGGDAKIETEVTGITEELTSVGTNSEMIAAPSFEVKGVIGGRQVTFSSVTEDVVIYYSATSSSLTTQDTCLKNGETVLFENFYGTIYARAYKDGVWSNVSRLILKIPTVNTPTIKTSGDKLVISTTTPSAYIYYTTDGSVPSPSNGIKAYGSATINNVSATVKAIAVRSCFSNSSIVTESFTTGDLTVPSFVVKGVIGGRQITFNAEEGSRIYYSTSSQMSTTDTYVNTGESVTFNSFYGTIYARTFKDGKWSNTARLILKIPTVNAPTILVVDGYATIKTTTPKCTIYYTTDGSVPSPTNGKRITASSGRVYVGTNGKIKAIAVRSCFSNSEVAVLKEASVVNYQVSMDNRDSTIFLSANGYAATTPKVISFVDNRGYYNNAYETTSGDICIQRYDPSNMSLVSSIRVVKKYDLLGNITCDLDGYYYIIWGQSDTNDENCVVICVSKYDYNGNLVGECAINGYDSNPYPSSGSGWGTQQPFRSGNCSVTIDNGVLACNYSRTMYNGHQSNFVFYVDCSTMNRINPTSGWQTVPYCSHSFDQRIIGTSDGGFLVANHGDAFDRGFMIAKIADDKSLTAEIVSFHFREGSNRSYGYNETYAQLGGIAETQNGYVLCASSERTLSLDVAPTNRSYCGHSEARDLFIQILKKDFYSHSGGEQYLVQGVTRKAVGTAPTDALTNLYLQGNEVDYGVIWLTQYDADHYVSNPKVVATDDGNILVMWDRRSYTDSNYVHSYYTVLNEAGVVVVPAVEIRNSTLAGNIDPVYYGGKIYWTTSDTNGDIIHCINVETGPREWQ